MRKAARELLTLEAKHPRRLFEGNALIRRLIRIGVLDESKQKLDYVLGLKVEDFLERRLQTQVFKLGLAKSIHHARVLITQRHIRLVLNLFILGLNTFSAPQFTHPSLPFPFPFPFPITSVGKQIVNVPSFIVRLDSQKHIDFALNSPYGGGRPGRVKRKRSKAAESGEGEGEEDDE